MFTKRVSVVFMLIFFFSIGFVLNSAYAQVQKPKEAIEKEEAVKKEETTKKEDKKVKETEIARNPGVTIETSMGNIEIELFQKEAPITVKNFLDYVKEGFYDGTIFHRVIDNFMIQGGGFTEDLKQKPTKPAIKNEAAQKLTNDRGTIAMARTSVIDSATSQFFINLKDNIPLNHTDETMRGFGYCVFGKVTKGMEVVDAIGKIPTTSKGMYRDVPANTVMIKKIYLMK